MGILMNASPQTRKQMLKRYLHDEIFQLNFYRAHMLYFLVTILVSSVIVYGSALADDSAEELRYIDALFLSCSAMTTTGM